MALSYYTRRKVVSEFNYFRNTPDFSLKKGRLKGEILKPLSYYCSIAKNQIRLLENILGRQVEKFIVKDFYCVNKLPNSIGNKAKNLALLLKTGYSVPSFFVVTTKLFQHIFQKFMASTNNVDSFEEAKKFFDEIEFGNGILPAKFWKLFERQFNGVQSRSAIAAVSVRSSTAVEDSANQSFAGQFATFLDVKDKIAAWQKIKKCWLSLWLPQVQSYFRLAKICPETKAMAVIIQQMIHPDFAGVLFTRDPVIGDEKMMWLEFSPGTAEAVVSGAVDPFRIQINKSTKKLSYLSVKDKKISWEKIFPLFAQEKIEELINIGFNLERYFGRPVDIEWAIEKQKLWLLQVRPTTAGLGNERQRCDENGQWWTDYFFVERFVAPVTPLGWSIIGKWITKRALRQPLYYLGFDKLSRSRAITQTFAAYPYTRIEVFQSLYSVVPDFALSADKKTAFINQSQRRKWWQELMKRTPCLISRLVFRDLNFFPPLHLSAWQRFLKYYLPQLANNTKPLGQMDVSQLHHWFLQVEALTDEFLSYHRWSITFADLLFHTMELILPRLLPETKELNVADLFSGLPSNKTVEANLELAQIAHDCKTKKRKNQNIAISELEENPDFNRRLEKFLQNHGHRSENLDPYYPTWRDNPQFIKKMISALMSAPPGKSAIEVSQEQAKNNRQQAEALLLSSLAKQHWLRALIKKKLIFALLKMTRSFILLRENQRYYWHLALAEKRRIILEVGQRLVAKRVFDFAEQIFFLWRSEFLQIFRAKVDLFALQKKAASRHKKWQQTNSHSATPSTLRKNSKTTEAPLRGLGVSAGKITAEASVVFSLSQAEGIRPGTILVTRSVDPAWTPVFAKAAGLVLEVGGILSHASIIAREFKLPAVTSVAQATQKIVPGQLIEIDGATGIVNIIEEQEKC